MGRRTVAVLNRAVAEANRPAVSDRELLLRYAKENDQAAFEALVNRHHAMVFGACRRALSSAQDAEDACQATFLLLARKAGSVRWQASVANWLYTTARQVASNARAAAERRLQREVRSAVPEAVEPVDLMTARELFAVLDEELGRLAPCYREVLVLCHLEGLTLDEAATRLGVPVGTLKSRSARGRKLLADALTGRGCALGVGLLALAVTSPAGASPPRLVRSILAAVSGSPSAAAGELVKGVAVNGSFNKAVLAVALGVIALGTGLGAIGVNAASPPRIDEVTVARNAGEPTAPDGRTEPRPDAPPAPVAQPAKEAEPLPEAFTYRGRAVGPDDKPAAGAEIYLLAQGATAKKLGVAGADGRFTVTASRGERRAKLVVKIDGAGIDFVDLGRVRPTEEVELRAVKDRPIRGRVVDTQGKPVAGATVAATSIEVFGDTLDPFLAGWKTGSPQFQFPSGTKDLNGSDAVLAPVTTDADGRFTVKGIGDERLVQLYVRGSGIATDELWVVNRAGFDPKPYNRLTDDKIALSAGSGQKLLLYGPGPEVVAESEKPVRGVVKDGDTGKPRAGVTVTLEGSGLDRGATAATPQLSARTDAEGRYEIRGARKAKAYVVTVPEDTTGGYLAAEARAEDTPGHAPITLDVEVRKGVVVTGRVFDKATGKPLPGFAMVAVLNDNKFVKDYPRFDPRRFRRATGADGTFRLVSIPGPVLLMGGPDERRMPEGVIGRFKYKPAVPDPKYPQYFSTESPFGPGFYSIGGGIGILHGNCAKVLDLKPGADVVTCDIEVELTTALPVRIGDADGKPVTGTWVTGLGPREWEPPLEVKGDSCAAYHLDGKPRLMVFCEPAKKLFGTLSLKGDEKGPVTATLGPGGAVTGRVVGEDGKPLSGVAVRLRHRDRRAEAVHTHVHRARPVETDAEGKFRIDDVIPGAEIELAFTRGKVRFEPVGKSESRTAEPGKVTDAGALRLKPAAGP